MGEEQCVGSCMTEKEDYTYTCADCFGQLTACTKKQCFAECSGGSSGACAECTWKNCVPAFTSCCGIIDVPMKEPATPTALALVEGKKAGDACKNDADEKTWTGKGEANFESDLSECGRKCMGE